MNPIKILLKLCFFLLAILPLTAIANPVPLTIETLDIEKQDFPLPAALIVQNEMNRLIKPERDEAFSKITGRPIAPDNDFAQADDIPHYGLHLNRTSDGITYLIDNRRMALWIRKGEVWTPIITGVHINKTFGGAPASLPVKYLGNGVFAITETLPGETEERDKENLNLPQAFAATFLIDSKTNTVLARTKAFLYSENPPVRIPEDWMEKFKLQTAVWKK